MKTAVLPIILLLLVLTSLCYGQYQISFDYPGDWDCASHSPLTFDNPVCWQGTPIPDGTEIQILKNGAPFGTFSMNSDFICGNPIGGFFSTTYFDFYPGERAQLVVQYGLCTYTTAEVTPTSDNTYSLSESDWTCNCGHACAPTESGSDGPYDIASGATKIFFAANDTCTMRITAEGGAAHGVTVQVFDAVPQFHPTGFDYMSRIVAIYWNGSADPTTTLRVRMYYTSSELSESGFTGSSCLRAARFTEFGVNWFSITPTSSGSQYIEFLTKRSGYYTFDCHGTGPRSIPGSGPTVSSGNGELVLRWHTQDEFENYAFHILRAENSEGPYVEVATVNSQLPNIMTAASFDYEYRDAGLENGHYYYYRMSSEDLHGNIMDYPTTVYGIPSVNGDAVEINEYRLYAAYPNPFNPETRITYDVRDAGHVTLCVYDILGREVSRLVDMEQPRGRYNVTFNAKDLPSGLYFYRINMGQFTSTQKMLLLK